MNQSEKTLERFKPNEAEIQSVIYNNCTKEVYYPALDPERLECAICSKPRLSSGDVLPGL